MLARISIAPATTNFPFFRSHARDRVLQLCAVAILLIAPREAAAQTPCGDCWEGPFDWSCQVVSSGTCPNQEFSHAALIPRGDYRGKVLLWQRECFETTTTYMFDPATPSNLLKISTPLTANLFCSGAAWDRDGQLVVAGGQPVSTSNLVESYRFFPAAMGYPPSFSPPVTSCSTGAVSGTPWRRNPPPGGDMSVSRYYPTLITLLAGVIAATSPNSAIPSSSSFVIGGRLDPQIDRGNEFWQCLPPMNPVQVPWSHTLVPEPGFPPTGGHAHPTSPTEEYKVRSMTPELPEVIFESYPHALQLTDLIQGVQVFKKNIFIAHDINTVFSNKPPLNTPRKSWVVRARYAGGPPDWELWKGPEEDEDRFYGTAVLLHTKHPSLFSNGLNRVLVFGGATNFGSPNDPPNWQLSVTVAEFVPGTNPATGSWETKAPLNSPRAFPNAVVLPTGEILIIGGLSAVNSGNINDYSSGATPEHRPELYDPGTAGQGGTGSSMYLTSSPLTSAGKPYARAYHNVAVLLPDGRVLSAGGHDFNPPPATQPGYTPDDRFTGEVYSPPYLGFGFRPAIIQVSSDEITFSSSFTVQVEHTKQVDAFVLLRPASVTHSFDADQRYIELDFGQLGEIVGGHVFQAIAPADDLAPEGYYMLFVVEKDLATGQRAPSTAYFLRLKS